jgi:hypothetical protein
LTARSPYPVAAGPNVGPRAGLGWGIGVVMNAWDVYFAEDFGEDDIDREMQRLSR